MPSPVENNIVRLPLPDTTGDVRSETSLRKLIQSYERRLYRHLSRKLNQQDVEDALQEIYIRLTRILRLEAPTELNAGYVFKVANSVIHDLYRRRKVRHFDNHVEIDHDLEAKAPSPLDELLWRQTAEIVKQAINQLPKIERRILLMHRVDTMTLNEISKELDIPLRTVERQLCRALATCRLKLEELGCFSQL